MTKKKTATPLFLQALGLILATLAAAWLASGVVIILLPQPVIDIYRVGEVAESLMTGRGVHAIEGRTLVVKHGAGPVRDDNGARAVQF